MVSECPDGKVLTEGRFRIEHWPAAPTGGGLAYYWSELRKCRRMVRAAKRFKADVAILDSGAVPFFMMELFRLAGIPVVVVLHNTIWPHSFRHRGGLHGLTLALDGLFFRHGANAVVAVSPRRRARSMRSRRAMPARSSRSAPSSSAAISRRFRRRRIGRPRPSTSCISAASTARRACSTFP